MTASPDDSTRERILDAAAALVESRPADFTVDRVANAAGVSRATVYRRFASAGALVETLEEERGVAAAGERIDVRHRLLEAGRVEFVSAGVGGTTVSAIAGRAGVSTGTLYNHFPDKESLLTALLAERGPASLLPPIQVDQLNPGETLETFVRGALELGRDHGELFRLLFAPDPVTRRAFNRVRKGTDGLEAKLATILMKIGLAADVAPEDAVVSLMGMIFANGVFIPMMTDTPIEEPDRVAARITRIFLNGVSSVRDRNTAPGGP